MISLQIGRILASKKVLRKSVFWGEKLVVEVKKDFDCGFEVCFDALGRVACLSSFHGQVMAKCVHTVFVPRACFRHHRKSGF